MSLHIFLNKRGKEEIQEFFERFIKEFNISLDDSNRFKIGNVLGYYNLHKENEKIFGDIEFEIYSNKLDKREPQIFIDLLKKSIIKKNDLDKFLIKNKEYLNKVYIDVDGDGELNPLNILYEYDVKGDVIFRKIIKVLEELHDEEGKYKDILPKMKLYERNKFSNNLWNNDKIKNWAINEGKNHKLSVSEGSFKLYAKDKESLRNYYESLIKNLIEKPFQNKNIDPVKIIEKSLD